MEAIRRRTAQAIAQVERRQTKQSVNEARHLRRVRVLKAAERQKIVRENLKLSNQQVREKWQLGELQSRPGYLEEAKKNVSRQWEPKNYDRREEKKKEELEKQKKKSREAALLRREAMRKNPEFFVAVSGRVAQ